MAKVIVPAVLVAVTAGVGGMFSFMAKKVTPFFAAVK